MKDDTRAQLVEAVDKARAEADEAMAEWNRANARHHETYRAWMDSRHKFEAADQALAAYDLARLRENDNAK
jgi:hypothetical protein